MDTALLTSGPARVYVDISGTPTEVGHIKGGVHIRRDLRTLELMADELGDEPANEIVKGSVVEVSFSLAEYSLVNIRRAFVDSKDLQDDTTSTKQSVEIRAKVGLSLLGVSRKWTIKPIDPATGDVTTDANKIITVWKGTPSAGSVELVFSPDEQRLIPVTLKCYADTAANKYRKVTIGDTTIVDANESGFTF